LTINDKLIEIIVRQMLRIVRIHREQLGVPRLLKRATTW